MTVVDAPVIREDQAAWPGVSALVSCLCQEMEAANLGPLCLCSPLPGSQIALDYGTEGMAWVRVVGAWPSETFPAQAPSRGRSCTAPLAIQLEVGAARCAPAIGDQGELPTLTEQFDVTRLQMADMAAMRRAIQCCATAQPGLIELGQYTPGGPQGGVVWGTWSVFIEEGWGRG